MQFHLPPRVNRRWRPPGLAPTPPSSPVTPATPATIPATTTISITAAARPVTAGTPGTRCPHFSASSVVPSNHLTGPAPHGVLVRCHSVLIVQIKAEPSGGRRRIFRSTACVVGSAAHRSGGADDGSDRSGTAV